uniref:DEAD-box ATP-dependent RNA helicase 42-like n=1 Tax=Erigeron canadensis TaxID=72917 RepID=UPI001CB9C6DD|nr:DEAD-box ATP-dependent RNA helicase 42-like [Erigeron canadensis]XP_043622122.1 DEAD-box ATP-dependent RNA helicase 42-like [Erigeron canadensis]
MTPKDVAAYIHQLQLDIVGGNDVPNPIKTWRQFGLPSTLLETIRTELKYAKAPLPIQAQALPVIMSGRDCIAVANTGSGKILAFVLPMMAHLMAVRIQGANIALVVAPTIDVVHKIYTSLLKFTRFSRVACLPLYSGGCADIFKQNSLLKVQTGLVIGTPDTIISTGEIKSVLARVTFLVMYQTDRMLDMGFETRLISIVSNIRHDCQNLIFSSTFNHDGIRLLARKVAYKPVEIHAHPMSPPLVEEVNQGIVYHPRDSCYEAQLEINDFPLLALGKVIRRETMSPICKWTRTTVIVKGQYIQPPFIPHPGERKLYLSIKAATEQSASLAKAEIHRILQASSLSSSQNGQHFSQVSELGSIHA